MNCSESKITLKTTESIAMYDIPEFILFMYAKNISGTLAR